MSADLTSARAWQLAAGFRAGDHSAREVSEAFLDRVERLNPSLGALLHVDRTRVLQQADAVDAKRAAGQPLGALAGVPIAVKDNLCERGQPLTCASRILENYRPPYDAHVIEQLSAADAVVIGRCNMDEFAMGSSTEHSAFRPAKNPWDTTRAPGGSSGGSAVSVAARLSPLALGSDTGGSVRQPGAFCGVTALKPTYGRVSRYGLVAFASSLDNVGPMGRDTRDVASALQVIAGPDPRDATCVDRPVGDYLAACERPVGKLRVGLMRDVDQRANDPAVTRSFEQAVGTLEELGMEVVPVELPHAKFAVATYYLVATAEASSNLARFDGMRYGLRVPGEDVKGTYNATRTAGFGPEVQLRILLGTYALSAGYYDAFYLKAQKVRTLIMRDFSRAFESCDVVASPTAPTPAFELGAKTQDPLSMYLGDIYTLPASLAGLPAINVPCGFTDAGLPMGLQLMAPHFEEERLFSAAAAYESATDHVARLSPLD